MSELSAREIRPVLEALKVGNPPVIIRAPKDQLASEAAKLDIAFQSGRFAIVEELGIHYENAKARGEAE